MEKCNRFFCSNGNPLIIHKKSGFTAQLYHLFCYINSMKFHRFQCLLTGILVSICICVSPAQQTNTDVRFRLAQSYERSGDYESALKLYNEMYAKDSSNVVIFESLRRNYLLLKRYDDVITL